MREGTPRDAKRAAVEAASPAAYATGFVLASGLLHGAGILIGTVRIVPRGDVVLRVIGAGIAVTGAWLLAGRFGA